MTKAPTRGCGCKGEQCRLSKGDERHGSSSTYRNYGCRCQRCRRAWSAYHRKWVHSDPERVAREAARRRARYLKKKIEKKAMAA